MATATRNRQNNGAPVKVEVSPEQLADAAHREVQIANEAAEVWEDAGSEALTGTLFRRLRSLLRAPIPDGYLSEVSRGTGKPYDSKGIKSVQVQIDRMDAVLGECNWDWETKWLNDAGTLAEVTVSVGPHDGPPLFIRKARGGVDRGSTLGNTHKGSETNAAKLAFARVGPGHEVYLGLTDLDPDTDEDVAAAQAQGNDLPPIDAIDSEAVAELVSLYESSKGASGDAERFANELKFQLGTMGVPTPSVNRAFASLTPAQAVEIEQWLNERRPQ